MKADAFANPLNVSEVVYRALKTKMCSYHELNTCLGLEAAMNIIEVWQVADYNDEKMRYIAEQEAKRG